MKRSFFIILLLLLSQQLIYSQEIEHKIENNIHCYSTKYGITIKSGYEFYFTIENYLENGMSEYYICSHICGDDPKNCILPPNGKISFEIIDGSIIELTPVLIRDIDYFDWNYYPISTMQLEKLLTGIRNIKIDILAFKSKNEIKKSCSNIKSKLKSFVEFLKTSYEAIENEKRKM